MRMLLYRPRDIDPACTLIEELFLVPEPDEFRRDHRNVDGYQARHRVVSLRVEDIDADPGATNLRNVPCEVQVATIPDHIWNEIERDIIYKTPHGRPTDVQRVLLQTLRGELNMVRETVDKLMKATDAQRAKRPLR